MKHISTILALLAALILTDLQWTVMQSVAWVQMVLVDERGPEVTLLTVVVDTISGKAPCTSCRAIEQGRKSDQEKTLDLMSKVGVVAPLTFSEYAIASPEGESLAWTCLGDRFLDDPNPWSIDHPPRV